MSASNDFGWPIAGPLVSQLTWKSSTVKLSGARLSGSNIEPGAKSSYWLSVLENPCPTMVMTLPL
jgi:hypothetical protein